MSCEAVKMEKKKPSLSDQFDRALLFDPAFMHCAEQAISEPELVSQFDRLYGANLSMRGPQIVLMVEKATGKLDDDFKTFLGFVQEFIYKPLLAQFRNAS